MPMTRTANRKAIINWQQQRLQAVESMLATVHSPVIATPKENIRKQNN